MAAEPLTMEMFFFALGYRWLFPDNNQSTYQGSLKVGGKDSFRRIFLPRYFYYLFIILLLLIANYIVSVCSSHAVHCVAWRKL